MTEFAGQPLVEALDQLIEKYHLLQHPFYQSWTAGTLSRESLALYAVQYYQHVEAFPHHLRTLAGRSEDELRELVEDNLREEEHPAAPHPKLWREFAEAVGVDAAAMDSAEALPGLQTLVDTYSEISEKGSLPEAVAAFYAYEAQVPEIATQKIAGLKQHYGVDSPKGLAYFVVHEEADVRHRAAWRNWLARQSDADKEAVLDSAERGLQALWGALDAVHLDAHCASN